MPLESNSSRAGFPAVSPNEKQCVKTIANLGLTARVCGFARAREPDVATAIDCDVDMVSIFIPTSELHVRLKFKKPVAGAGRCTRGHRFCQ